MFGHKNKSKSQIWAAEAKGMAFLEVLLNNSTFCFLAAMH